MAVPAVTQSWVISANNHYVFSSVLGAMQALAFSIKGFLKTTMGMTVKGSCTAGTGAMDATDRWATAADVTPRNNGAAGSQAWFVITDGSGVDYCFSFNSASDDVFRLGISPGGIYVVAGTANQQPTATDEVTAVTIPSWVNTTASGDRMWHLWGSRDKTMWRCVNSRLGAFQSFLGVDRLASNVYAPVTFVGLAPVVVMFLNSSAISSGAGASTGSPSVNTGARAARVHVNGVDATVLCGGTVEANLGSITSIVFGIERPELQGGGGDLLTTLGCSSNGSLASGKLGNHYDWWVCYSNSIAAFGDVFGNLELFVAGDGIVLPWDGSTPPTLI